MLLCKWYHAAVTHWYLPQHHHINLHLRTVLYLAHNPGLSVLGGKMSDSLGVDGRELLTSCTHRKRKKKKPQWPVRWTAPLVHDQWTRALNVSFAASERVTRRGYSVSLWSHLTHRSRLSLWCHVAHVGSRTSLSHDIRADIFNVADDFILLHSSEFCVAYINKRGHIFGDSCVA